MRSIGCVFFEIFEICRRHQLTQQLLMPCLGLETSLGDLWLNPWLSLGLDLETSRGD